MQQKVEKVRRDNALALIQIAMDSRVLNKV